MARALLPFLSTAVGMLLLLQAGYPLYAFAVDSMNGGLNVTYTIEDNKLVVTLEYGVRVPLKEAVLKLTTDTGKEWSSSDPSLEPGEKLVLEIPLSELEDVEEVTLSIEGSIAGIYKAGLQINAGGIQG